MKSPQSIRILLPKPSRSLGGQELGTHLEIGAMVAHGFKSSLIARLDTPILAEPQMRGLDANPIYLLNKAGHDKSEPAILGQCAELNLADSPMDAMQVVDELLMVIEWKTFSSHNIQAMKVLLKATVLIDRCTIYEPKVMSKKGFDYFPSGRP